MAAMLGLHDDGQHNNNDSDSTSIDTSQKKDDDNTTVVIVKDATVYDDAVRKVHRWTEEIFLLQGRLNEARVC